jgi:hypothetical protein
MAPLTITKSEIEELVFLLEETFEDFTKQMKSGGV